MNPLAEDDEGALIAADAKLGFDDNAAFRQKDIFAMRDASQEDPRWAALLPCATTIAPAPLPPCGSAAPAPVSRKGAHAGVIRK